MLRRVSPLAGETILPLADAKTFLRVRHSEEDALISTFRDAAILHVERVVGVSLAVATYTWTVKRLSGPIDLPVRPAVAVTGISYSDSAGAAQTYSDARLAHNAVFPALGGAFPTTYGPAVVTFTAGFADLAEAKDLLSAVKVQLQALYERDPANGEHYQRAVDSLLEPHRVVGI